DRLWPVGGGFRRGLGVDEVFALTAIDPWFLRHIEEIVTEERALAGQTIEALSAERLRALKQAGFADARLAELLGTTEEAVCARRTGGIEPVYKTVDTCGAEFEAHTPLRPAMPPERAGAPIVGTSPDSIDRAEDRERFEEVLTRLELLRPPNGIARSADEATRVAETIGYPVLVRPSYVLGGRAMEIVYDGEALARYVRVAVKVSPAHPVLIDHFL